MAIIDEILGHFNELNYVVLATVEHNKPRLRHRGAFFFATGAGANKVRQLDDNPKVEILLQWKEEPNNGYIRLEGKASREDSETVGELYIKFDYFSKLWSGPEDPSLLVYRMEPSAYDYMKPGEWTSEKLVVKP